MSVDLSGLRGLHLPTGGGGWVRDELAFAVGLGIAFGLLFALLVGLGRFLRDRRRASIRHAALNELVRARSLDPDIRVVAQARLLRRVVRTVAGDTDASTQGSAWAATLDRTFATTFFSQGAGHALIDGLYRRPQPVDSAIVDAELERLLARIKG